MKPIPGQELKPAQNQIRAATSQIVTQQQQRLQPSNISQQKGQNQIEESHCIRVLSKDIKYAQKIQLWFIGKQYQKQYQKMKKKYRYRNNVLAEIVNTERTYVNDVNIICEKVIGSCSQVLPKQDIETIFMNIQEILDWNKRFLQILEKGYEGYNQYKQTQRKIPTPYKPMFEGISDLLENEDQAFKCYFEYCGGFTKSNKTLEQLKANNQSFKDYLVQLNRSGSLRGMDLASFLVKPVQRLPKYILLFKDLEKNTDDDYPDLKFIKKIHKYFRDVNEDNNKTMDVFMGRLQLQELCESLRLDREELLVEQNRVYKFEEKLTTIQPNAKKDEDCTVVIHALSDMIIVMHEDKVQKKIKLDSLSFVKDQSENNKYFSNLFQIVGVGDTLQCIAETASAKKKYMDKFEKLIQENRQQEHEREKQNGIKAKMRYPVQVVVVGTEERNFQSFSKHTQYITDISISKVSQNIFIRYSEIQTLSSKYKKRYPKIELPELPDKNWLMSHKTKQIEARKIAIENFLQALLQAKEVQEDQEILNELKLPKEFFDLPELDQAQEEQIKSQIKNFKRTTFDELEELKEKGIKIEKLTISAGEILKAIQVSRTIRKRSVVQLRPNIVEAYDPQKSKHLKKVIITFPDGTETALGITEQTRVSEVLEKVAKYNGLNYYQDFRLYLIDKLKKQRVLDGDEVLYKVVQEEETNSNFFNKIEQLLARSNPDVIIKVKKYIYFPANLEECDYKENNVRLINLAFSVLDDVHDQKLQLGFKEYCLFSALYFHMKHQRIDDQLFGEISRVVPQEMYKSSPEKEWKDLVFQCFKALENELEMISKKNVINKNEKKPNSQYKHTDKKYLAAGVTLNAARTFVQSQMAMFQVQVYEGTQKQFKSENKEMQPTIYLGFSIYFFHFLNPQRKEQFRQFRYSQIKSVKSYPSQVIFEMDMYKEPLRFDTYQSYEIKQLVEQYKEIQKFDEELNLGHQFSRKS